MNQILIFLGGSIIGSMLTIIFAYKEGFNDGYKKGKKKWQRQEKLLANRMYVKESVKKAEKQIITDTAKNVINTNLEQE